MYAHCKEKDDAHEHSIYEICTYEVPEKKKFNKCFLDYLEPEEAQEEDGKPLELQSRNKIGSRQHLIPSSFSLISGILKL